VAAGGDGTINEVLNGLAGHFDRVQFGILPLGTANDLARSLAVPSDLNLAVALLAEGQSRRVDLVRLLNRGLQTPHYFINVSAGGFSAVVDENLEPQHKAWWRSLAYAISAAKSLPQLEAYPMRLTFDGQTQVETEVFNLVVANGRYVGGGIDVAPQSRLDDGLMDVIIFRATTMARVALVVPKTLLGQHLDDDDVLFYQARTVEITSEKSFELNADGELIGCCPARFDICPQALEVIVGPNESAGAR
jgi:diacylglycerol kinase (ATP)